MNPDPISEHNLRQLELMAKQEPLCEELEACHHVVAGKFGFPAVRHPLVYSVPHFPQINAFLNHQLIKKKAVRDECLTEKDWDGYVFVHERPYRVKALNDIKGKVKDKKVWAELCASVWTDSENCWSSKEFWFYALTELKDSKHFMSEDEATHLKSLFEKDGEITVYRGCERHNKRGFSWTTDSEQAVWFANRLASSSAGRFLLSVKVKRENVVAYFAGRGENEIVLDPVFTSKTRNIKTEKI